MCIHVAVGPVPVNIFRPQGSSLVTKLTITKLFVTDEDPRGRNVLHLLTGLSYAFTHTIPLIPCTPVGMVTVRDTLPPVAG